MNKIFNVFFKCFFFFFILVICTSFPPDPFKNTPLFNILGKVFANFFKSLVTLTASNPPTNFAPQRVTKFSLIVTVLTSHGLKWHRLIPLNFKLAYRCSCIKPTTSTPTTIPTMTRMRMTTCST